MSDTTEILRDPRVRAYLTEVHREVSGVNAAAADGIMREIADHIRDAAAEPAFDLDATLTELGDPVVIAAAVEPAPTVVAPREAFVDSGAGVILAVLLLTVGTYALQILGWALAMLLLWTSRRWNTTDKVVGTVVWPAAILGAVLVSRLLGIGPLFMLIATIAPVPVAIWLLIRAFRGARPLPEPRVPPASARVGGWAWSDRWPAGVAVMLAPVLLILALAPYAIIGNPRAAISGGIGALALFGGALAILWVSRGWTRQDKVSGTTSLILFALSLIAGPLTGSQTGGSVMCAGTECLPVPAAGSGAAPLELTLQLAVPLMLLHAVYLGIRFRSAETPGRLTIGRSEAWGIVALVTVGGTAFACFVIARFGAAIMLVPAAVILVPWAVGVILLWRADGWTGIDRVVGTFVLPVLVAFPLYAPLATAADGNPLMPGASVAEPGGAIAWGVFIVVELLVAGWLLVRFQPRSPS